MNEDRLFSRSQWQEYLLEIAAKSGNFFAYLKLFPNERRRLTKRGFTVLPLKQSNNETVCLVHFLNSFPNGIPLILMDYLMEVIEVLPLPYENQAQELFTIAFKKAYCK